MTYRLSDRARIIREMAFEAGFYHVGMAKAEQMQPEAIRLEKWLNAGLHGQMEYMGNYFDKRIDPTRLVPGAKTVISLAYNYYTPQKQADNEAPKISQYAYGVDYHKVVKKKLKSLYHQIQEQFGKEISGRYFVDSAPVLERDWAKRAGLGWIGKNTMLINPKKGSFFFLAEIILDLEMAYDEPMKDYCGTCRKCIDACPTQAISPEGYFMDGSKCISYLTIELKDAIPDEFAGRMENWTFGCDVCQDVCPWNRFSEQHDEEAFQPTEGLLEMSQSEWEEMTQETFDRIFHRSAVKRTKFGGLKRNLLFLKKNQH